MSFQEENIDLNKLPFEEEEEQENSEMGFFDHLGELRRRVIFALIGVGIGCGISSFFLDILLDDILLNPLIKEGFVIQNLNTMGQPILYIKLLIISGFVVGFPFVIYQVWKFVEPGLYASEKNWARSIVFFTTICFLIGLAFAYYVMIPSMLKFAAGFGSEHIENNIEINKYLALITNLSIAAGLFFELPVVSYILSRVGFLTPKFMRNYRRHAIVAILIIAAIITPSPDPVNQLIVAVPIYILYELSIYISGLGLSQYLSKRDIN